MSRQIKVADIQKTVKELCLKANTVLRPDVAECLVKFCNKEEEGSVAKKMMEILLENIKIAEKEKMPICQDTGMLTVFIEIGQDIVLTGGNLVDAINGGIEKAYSEGNFRKSIVSDPILRKNTGTNTPAVIHTDIVEGDKIKISVIPKGFGCENKSRVAMLNPTCTTDDIIDFCVDTAKKAGPDACPPFVLGIGIGGTMEHCTLLAKKALLRNITESNLNAHIAELEAIIKEKLNDLNIGTMGLGGCSTVIGVNIESACTHIAGLPVAVNISCHALRSASAEI